MLTTPPFSVKFSNIFKEFSAKCPLNYPFLNFMDQPLVVKFCWVITGLKDYLEIKNGSLGPFSLCSKYWLVLKTEFKIKIPLWTHHLCRWTFFLEGLQPMKRDCTFVPFTFCNAFSTSPRLTRTALSAPLSTSTVLCMSSFIKSRAATRRSWH